MDDNEIVKLYYERSESAIEESQKKYGGYCRSIARRILDNMQDVEECVNDAYLDAWNSIPPKRPKKLGVFLGVLTRNRSLNRLDYNRAQKRAEQMTVLLDEFASCFSENEECIIDAMVFKKVINEFLESLDAHTRVMFVQRYWYMCKIDEIANSLGVSEASVKTTLHRTRNKLKALLQKEGIVK